MEEGELEEELVDEDEGEGEASILPAAKKQKMNNTSKDAKCNL